MELEGKKLEVSGGMTKKTQGGKRKMSEWNKHLMKVFRNMQKKNKSVKLRDAMKAAAKIPYKKGGSTTLNTKKYEGGDEHKKMEGGDEHKKMEGGDEHKKMEGGKRSKKKSRRSTRKRRGGNKHAPDMEM